MNIIQLRVQRFFDEIPREFRVPVSAAADLSDGTLLDFHQELENQTWEYPDLPVNEIVNIIAYDVV
jgi:hypothetical protein